MNDKPFFVMLYNKHGFIRPMLTGGVEGQVQMFESIPDAIEAAEYNPLGQTYGYDIFEKGNGVDGADGI